MEPRPNAIIHTFYGHVSHNFVEPFALQSSGPKTGSKNALDPKLIFHSKRVVSESALGKQARKNSLFPHQISEIYLVNSQIGKTVKPLTF